MNNTLEGILSRITEAEAQIKDLEGRMVETTATGQNRYSSSLSSTILTPHPQRVPLKV